MSSSLLARRATRVDSGGVTSPGRFTYHVAGDRWEWGDDVYAIHGYAPGEVRPTTELFLRHKHRADRKRVEDTFQRVIRTGEPFNVYFRVVAHGTERRVVVVGEGVRGDDGRVARLEGYYLDLTPEFDAESSAAADAAVEASASGRATIEQAKGVLMLGYGLHEDAAFAMLRWWSRNRNLKVREIAERLLTVAREGTFSHPGLRRLLDTLIHDLTHEGAEGPGRQR